MVGTRRQGVPELSRISLGRIGAILEGNGDRFEVLSSDTIGAGWEDSSYWFQLIGDDLDVLHVHGRWRGVIEDSKIGRALVECNAWNASALFVRGYLSTSDGGSGTYIDSSSHIDCSSGITEAQLKKFIDASIYGSGVFFGEITRSLSS